MGYLKKIGRSKKRIGAYRDSVRNQVERMEDEKWYTIGKMRVQGKAWKEFLRPKTTLVAHEPPPGRIGPLPERVEGEAQVPGGDHHPQEEREVGAAHTDQP